MHRMPHVVPPWEPQGRALLDQQRATPMGVIHVHTEGGGMERVEPAHFFRGPVDFGDWETAALDAVRGDVLDLGAGAGCHSLALQARGVPVRAYDVDLRSVAVMRARGVRDARLGSLADVPDARCDTLLLLMHGVGLAGDVEGLEWLADEARRVVRPGGCWVLDGRGPGEPGVVCGVSRQQLEYDGVLGAPYDWLWPEEGFARETLEHAGWRARSIASPADGRWLLLAER